MLKIQALILVDKKAAMQRGVAMVFALLVLLSLTLMGLASVSSGLIQTKMASAMEQQSLAFEAAESAVSAVIFEAQERSGLIDRSFIDPISLARQSAAIDLSTTAISCFAEQGYVPSQLTQNGFKTVSLASDTGEDDSQARIYSWSRTAFVQEAACRGSSNVIGANTMLCQVFLIRGCGQVPNSPYAVANTLSVNVFTLQSIQ